MIRVCVSKKMMGVGVLCALTSGCVANVEDVDPSDPAASLDYEWWDDAPPEGEGAESSDEPVDDSMLPDMPEVGSTSQAASLGAFQLPFPCGQVWAGQTRSNHSPRNSIDFNRSNDYGDSVLASAAGRVTRVGNTGGTSYGRWIEIDHGSGYRTRYAHLASQSVRYGQSVSRGQKIGTVGSTGGSTGPHLHFELRRYGYAVRPVFNGSTASFYGTRNYKSYNRCSSTSSSKNGRIRTSGAALNVRSGPGTNHRVTGTRSNGQGVTVVCHKRGQLVRGTYGTTRLWDKLKGGGYVSDAYVYTGTDGRVAPWCK